MKWYLKLVASWGIVTGPKTWWIYTALWRYQKIYTTQMSRVVITLSLIHNPSNPWSEISSIINSHNSDRPWLEFWSTKYRAKKELIMLFWPIFGDFWCPVVTVVIFSSNLSKFERNPTKPKKFKKIDKIQKI